MERPLAWIYLIRAPVPAKRKEPFSTNYQLSSIVSQIHLLPRKTQTHNTLCHIWICYLSPNNSTSVIDALISFFMKYTTKRSNVNRCVYSSRKNGKPTNNEQPKKKWESNSETKYRHVMWFTSSLHGPQMPSNVFSIIWVAASQRVTRITATKRQQKKSAGINRERDQQQPAKKRMTTENL